MVLERTLLCLRGCRLTDIWQLSSAGKYRIVSWYNVKQVSNLIRKWFRDTECIEYGRNEQTVMVCVYGLVAFLFYFVVMSSHLLSLSLSHSFFCVHLCFTCLSFLCIKACVSLCQFVCFHSASRQSVSSSLLSVFLPVPTASSCFVRNVLDVCVFFFICHGLFLAVLFPATVCLPLDFSLGSPFLCETITHQRLD